MPVAKRTIASALRGATEELDRPRRKLAGRFAVSAELDAGTLRLARGLAAERDTTVSDILVASLRLVMGDARMLARLRKTLSPSAGAGRTGRPRRIHRKRNA